MSIPGSHIPVRFSPIMRPSLYIHVDPGLHWSLVSPPHRSPSSLAQTEQQPHSGSSIRRCSSQAGSGHSTNSHGGQPKKKHSQYTRNTDRIKQSRTRLIAISSTLFYSTSGSVVVTVSFTACWLFICCILALIRWSICAVYYGFWSGEIMFVLIDTNQPNIENPRFLEIPQVFCFFGFICCFFLLPLT